jgi:hypothetical protein
MLTWEKIQDPIRKIAKAKMTRAWVNWQSACLVSMSSPKFKFQYLMKKRMSNYVWIGKCTFMNINMTSYFILNDDLLIVCQKNMNDKNDCRTIWTKCNTIIAYIS